MKQPNEVLKPPERTKYDCIDNEQKYLDEKLSDWRREYSSEQNSAPQQSAVKKILSYVFFASAFVAIILGIVLKYALDADTAGYFILSFGCLLIMVGLLLTPRKVSFKSVNPFKLKLVKSIEMEVTTWRSKKTVVYSFFFDYKDEQGEICSALTEKEYSEEEKQKICESYKKGNLVVAVDTEDEFRAVIIEY